MEQVNIEVDKYLKEKHQYFKTKKGKAKGVHEVRLYSNELTKFATSLQDNILKIIKDGGITNEDEMNRIISSFQDYATKMIKDISITNE